MSLAPTFDSVVGAERRREISVDLTCGGNKTENKPILVPLTNSLYVSGTLSNASHVLVDIGTGFYVEKVFFLFFTKQIRLSAASRPLRYLLLI
jgi:hypothetical protein